MPLSKSRDQAAANGQRPVTQQRTRPVQADVNWFDGALEVPRAGTVGTRRLASRQRIVRWYVWASVVCTPLFALLALVEAGHGGPGPAVQAGGQVPYSAEVAAWREVQAWLGQSPSPLPGAHVLTWTGAKKLEQVHVKGSGPTGPAEDAWDESFLAVAHGEWYTVTTEVLVVPGAGAVALSGPAFVPVPPADQAAAVGASPWPGLQASTDVPAPVSTAISSWLAAYTSGNPESLLQATGDPSTQHAYIPLSGVASATVAGIVGAAGYGPPGQMIVEAQFYITWAGQGPSAVQGQSTLTTMDLLVERSETATPAVVAWGPPGSGTSLVPYEDAVPVSLVPQQAGGS